MKLFLVYLLLSISLLTHANQSFDYFNLDAYGLQFARLEQADAELTEFFDFDSTSPVFVSLGSFCGIAAWIQTGGLRKAAFPFDWYLTIDGEKLIELFQNNFSNYFNDDDLKLSPFLNNLTQTYYHIEFCHEGVWTKANYSENLEKFKNKAGRRVQRFQNLNTYKGKVIFIRSSYSESLHIGNFHDRANLYITPDYAARLYDALGNIFTDADYYLLIVNKNVNIPPDTIIKVNDKCLIMHKQDLNPILNL